MSASSLTAIAPPSPQVRFLVGVEAETGSVRQFSRLHAVAQSFDAMGGVLDVECEEGPCAARRCNS